MMILLTCHIIVLVGEHRCLFMIEHHSLHHLLSGSRGTFCPWRDSMRTGWCFDRHPVRFRTGRRIGWAGNLGRWLGFLIRMSGFCVSTVRLGNIAIIHTVTCLNCQIVPMPCLPVWLPAWLFPVFECDCYLSMGSGRAAGLFGENQFPFAQSAMPPVMTTVVL